jgi:hypothetical protein
MTVLTMGIAMPAVMGIVTARVMRDVVHLGMTPCTVMRLR